MEHAEAGPERVEVGPLLRVSKVAERLDCSKSTLYSMIRDGKLPTVTIGRSIRVPVSDLEAWLAQSRRGGHVVAA